MISYIPLEKNKKNISKEFYGETISERMIEMFNFFELTGKSRRR